MKKVLLIISLAVVVFLGWLVAAPFYVYGDCMESAVKDESYVFVNRLIPYVRDYRLNDIIVFEHENKSWISRIVGLENDTIEINDNGILLNGCLLPEKGFQRDWNKWKYGTYAIEKPFKIPFGHAYVLSDKLSAHHDDSRVFGPIAKNTIVGVVW